MRRRRGGAAHLVVDPTRCAGVSVCAHLAPDLVRLDSWGYPVLERGPLTGADQRDAARAVSGCPRRALSLEEA